MLECPFKLIWLVMLDLYGYNSYVILVRLVRIEKLYEWDQVARFLKVCQYDQLLQHASLL